MFIKEVLMTILLLLSGGVRMAYAAAPVEVQPYPEGNLGVCDYCIQGVGWFSGVFGIILNGVPTIGIPTRGSSEYQFDSNNGATTVIPITYRDIQSAGGRDSAGVFNLPEDYSLAFAFLQSAKSVVYDPFFAIPAIDVTPVDRYHAEHAAGAFHEMVEQALNANLQEMSDTIYHGWYGTYLDIAQNPENKNIDWGLEMIIVDGGSFGIDGDILILVPEGVDIDDGSGGGGHEEENTPPEITLNGDDIVHVRIRSTYNDPGATAYDLEDGEIPVTRDGYVNTWKRGTYELAYTATDSGELTTTITRTVIVEKRRRR